MRGRWHTLRISLLGLVLMLAPIVPAAAQLTDAPQPIPSPPIPKPPKIAPAPKIDLGALNHPPRPDIDIPAPPNLSPVAFPTTPIITPADKSDPTPPPRPGTETPAPPTISPGATPSGIAETAFLIDPASSELTPAAQAKLRDVAHSLGQSPISRLEVRAYAPVKETSESNARRLALARCVAVRDFLVSMGVSDDRIDIRALGSEPKDPNADRIELYVER